MSIEDAVLRLKRYCHPWDKGGAGDTGLTEDIRLVLAELATLRRWIEERECTCFRNMMGMFLALTPCPRCQIVATWGRKVSGHPGLKKESEE